MCTKTPPEYQVNPEHPPNKKTFPTTPCSLLPPHSLLAHRLYYIRLEAQIAKNKPQNTLFVPYCHYRHKI